MKLTRQQVFVDVVALGCAVSVQDRDGVELGISFPHNWPRLISDVDLEARFDGDDTFVVTARTPDGQAFLELCS